MKILIDIGHPAHIHYFKNCVKLLSEKGYDFLFVVRERDSTLELIKDLGFKYVSRGKGGGNIISKLLRLPLIDLKLYKIAKKFKPDMFLSFSSPYAAHVSWIMRKPHIAFDDTEHAVFGHFLYRPFTDVVLSPSCYNTKLSKNQMLFNSYMELCYLHPNYFTPDTEIFKELNLVENSEYCILRFVSWDANHDVGQHGLTVNDKIRIVKELSAYCTVYISSEQKLPEQLLKYKLNIHPSRLHHVLYYANLYIGEGSTTASEAVVLGTPAIYVNTLNLGYMDDESKYGLLYSILDVREVISRAKTILENSNSKMEYSKKKEIMLNDKIDPTAFILWFIENYPQSKGIMKEKPYYQNKFR